MSLSHFLILLQLRHLSVPSAPPMDDDEEEDGDNHSVGSTPSRTMILKKLSTPSRHRTMSLSQRRQSVEENIDQYRGIRSLYEKRHSRIYHRKKIPILSILYTTAFLQCLIVVCITTIITYRRETEAFFLNTKQSFTAIFGLDAVTSSHLLRTDNVISMLHSKFDIFFNLGHEYVDHYIYPDDIKVENKTTNNHSTHNLIPSATLKFVYDDDSTKNYNLNPMDYSILRRNETMSLIEEIQSSHRIHSLFEIEMYSFNNDVRNLWRWSIDCEIHFSESSNTMIAGLDLNYDRIGDDVSWWNKDSTAFTGSVIASFGLCAFSIMALARFTYKYGFLWKLSLVKQLGFRIMLPFSHCVSLLCGLIYLVNLSNFADWNDLWELRLVLAVCALLSWTMLVFGISTQGTEYGALFRALKLSTRPILILIISLLPIAVGFVFFGSVMFGVPDGNQMFSNPESTFKTLYAVWLGDEVLDTFYAAGVGNLLAEIYMYSWGILFIAIIFNVGLAIIEDNFFQTIPQLEKGDEVPSRSPSEIDRIDKINKEYFADDLADDESSDSNDDDDEGAVNKEWTLEAPEEYKNEIYILSKVKSGDRFSNGASSGDLTPIPLNTVLSHIPSSQELDENLQQRDCTPSIGEYESAAKGFTFGSESDLKKDDCSMESLPGLDTEEMKERNAKYTKLFVSHLKNVVMKGITERLIEKEIPKLLTQCPVDSEQDLDLLQHQIMKHYEMYLSNVKMQSQQFLMVCC